MGGPEPLSQCDAVRIFERDSSNLRERTMGTTWRLQFVPVEALQQQLLSSDPLQKTFGA